MGEGISVTLAGDLSKPATVLIEKISEATGGILKPWQIKRVAKAEAEAGKVKAIANLEITELEQRALQRFIREEAIKQNNIEEITNQALPQLIKAAKPEDIDDDWIANFFDKCRLVSDKDMQKIWSKILAREANSPGNFSKRTINFVSSLDKKDAQLFTSLCSFNWTVIGFQPLIYNTEAEIYTKHGIKFADLKHLDSIGLISFDNVAGYMIRDLNKLVQLSYRGLDYILTFTKEADNTFDIGKVLLTNIGQELASICNPIEIPEFYNYVTQEFSKQGVEIAIKK